MRSHEWAIFCLPRHQVDAGLQGGISCNWNYARSGALNLVVEGSTTVLEAASKKAESLKGTFNFLDEDCEVSYKATLQYTLDTGGELNFTSGSTLSSIPAATTGSNCIGEITFPFTVNALANELNISLGVNSRESNWLTATRKSEKWPPITAQIRSECSEGCLGFTQKR